jgi:hypothetical protein
VLLDRWKEAYVPCAPTGYLAPGQIAVLLDARPASARSDVAALDADEGREQTFPNVEEIEKHCPFTP